MENKANAQVPNCSSQSLSLLSEVPDIGNWFHSYEYESFVCDTYDDELRGTAIERSEEEGNGCESGRDCGFDDKLVDQAPLKQMEDSFQLTSQLSVLPHIGNWFSSYVYESSSLDTVGGLKESSIKENIGKINLKENNTEKDEILGKLRHFQGSNKRVSIEPLCSDMLINCSESLPHNRTAKKDLDSPPLTFSASEPLDIGNWFSSYAYESPMLEGNSESDRTETEKEENDIVDKKSSKEEKDSLKLRQTKTTDKEDMDNKVHLHTLLMEETSADYKHKNLYLNKDYMIGGKDKSIQEDFCHERKINSEDKRLGSSEVSNEDVEESSHCTKDPQFKLQQAQSSFADACLSTVQQNIEVSNDKLESLKQLTKTNDTRKNTQAEFQTAADLKTTGSKVEFGQATGSSITRLPHNGDDKEREVRGDGFVTTKKSRTRQPDRQQVSTRPQQVLSVCSGSKGTNSTDGNKRKVFSEITNRETSTDRNRNIPVKGTELSAIPKNENSNVIEVTGKWKCPMKGKPYSGPPLKQLRLDHWVHKV